MLQNVKLTIGVAASSAVVIIGTVWSLRDELVTQTQLGNAVAGINSKLAPVASRMEKLADQISDVDKRLSRLEGRLEPQPR